MLGRGAGIMLESGKAEVGARRVEQRERTRRVERAIPCAIGNLVTDLDEIGRRKPARQFGGRNAFEVEVAAVEHERVGDFAR